MPAGRRVVVDTNTLVSGILLPRSTPGKLLDFITEHGTFIFSPATRDELLDVIAREKFDRYVSADARERSAVISTSWWRLVQGISGWNDPSYLADRLA